MNQKDIIKNLQIFQRNSKLFYVHKKTERLISAIYLITDLISDQEPIKWSLRNLGNRLLSDSLSFVLNLQKGYGNFRNVKTDAYDIQASFLEIASLLEVACASGLISKMNHEIVIMELYSLLKILDEYEKGEIRIESQTGSNIQRSVPIPTDFFEIEENQQIIKDKIKDNINKSNIEKSLLNSKGQNIASSRSPYINNISSGISTASTKTAPQIKKMNRRESILKVLKESKGIGLTIKEIGVYNSCSEKTIQRELIDLINENLIKKEGERRWSKYYIK